MPEFIDVTPTWGDILPHWLMLYRFAVRGECDDNEKIIENAEAEFEKMAQAADKWNAYCKEQAVA